MWIFSPSGTQKICNGGRDDALASPHTRVCTVQRSTSPARCSFLTAHTVERRRRTELFRVTVNARAEEENERRSLVRHLFEAPRRALVAAREGRRDTRARDSKLSGRANNSCATTGFFLSRAGHLRRRATPVIKGGRSNNGRQSVPTRDMVRARAPLASALTCVLMVFRNRADDIPVRFLSTTRARKRGKERPYNRALTLFSFFF